MEQARLEIGWHFDEDDMRDITTAPTRIAMPNSTQQLLIPVVSDVMEFDWAPNVLFTVTARRIEMATRPPFVQHVHLYLRRFRPESTEQPLLAAVIPLRPQEGS